MERLFEKGARFSVTPFRVVYALSDEKGLRFAAGVSAKLFRKATERNRVKRVTREAWRLQKGPLREALQKAGTGLHVFLSYTAREIPRYQHVHDPIGIILQRLLKKIHENNTPDT